MMPFSARRDPMTDNVTRWRNGQDTDGEALHVAADELERLHTWQGLIELLDEHWPEDIFPTEPDSETRNPGPRVVSLLRWVERLRTDVGKLSKRLEYAHERLKDADAVNRGLRASLDATEAKRDALKGDDVRRLETQLREVCTCNTTLSTIDGPEEDCPLHGRDEFKFPALRERVVHLEAANERVRVAWSEWRGRLGGSFPPAMVQEIDAALDTPEETP
jgi:hypothetical protein